MQSTSDACIQCKFRAGLKLEESSLLQAILGCFSAHRKTRTSSEPTHACGSGGLADVSQLNCFMVHKTAREKL